MRSSTLDTLTDEQKDQLYDWLLEMPVPKVVEKVAQPAPNGFGLPTHNTTLQRFKQRRYAELAADQLEAAKAAAAYGNDALLDTAITTTLKRQLFERASTPDATSDDLALLARYVQRKEKIKIDIERVQIARERLTQNNRRLDLLERTTVVREQTLAFHREEAARRAASSPSPLGGERVGVRGASEPQSDHLGPYAIDLEGIRERARKFFGITPEESARRAALRKAWFAQEAQESNNSGDETHAAAEPVFVRQNTSPKGTPDITLNQNSAHNPSPEGTLDNSPASSVPGNSTTVQFSPEGTAELHPLQPAANE